MKRSIRYIAGCDPGGRDNFGVALLEQEHGTPVSSITHVCGSAREAAEWITEKVPMEEGCLLSMDTFLYWSPDAGGIREVDKLLRRKYPVMQRSIMSHNSTFGAMPVGGMSLAVLLSRHFGPNVQFNEAHPKVLYYLLTGDKYNFRLNRDKMSRWLINETLHQPTMRAIMNEHEFDALMCAYAGLQGIRGEYSDRLPKKDTEVCLFHPEIGVPAFYWPESL